MSKSRNQDVQYIANSNVRKIKRPYSVDVQFNQTGGPFLNVFDGAGLVEQLKISKKVAAVLIARGMAYEG